MENLRKLREEKGISQAKLSRITGVDKSTISLIENEHHVPSIPTLERLAEGLGIELADFFPKVAPPLFELADQRGEAPEGAFPFVAAILFAVGSWEALVRSPDWPQPQTGGFVDAALELGGALLAESRAEYFRDLPTSVQEDVRALTTRLVAFSRWALEQMESETPRAEDIGGGPSLARGAEAQRRREQLRQLTKLIA